MDDVIDWSTKCCKLFKRVADKQENFRTKAKMSDKKLDKTVASGLNQVKKARTLL